MDYFRGLIILIKFEMETQELTFEEKVKIIRESVRQTLAKCEVH